ncbi:hypothetical protein [Streptomyces sp. 1222.5]|uniref:hypothetical protein n=1 Tax=Streptomyces sp. 1222.5 TaxID=1881026 RepID=UPI003D72586A
MNHLLYGLAGNPPLPPDLLDRLISARPMAAARGGRRPPASPGCPSGRRAVTAEAAAANPSLPAGVMADLLRDPHVPRRAPMEATPTRH